MGLFIFVFLFVTVLAIFLIKTILSDGTTNKSLVDTTVSVEEKPITTKTASINQSFSLKCANCGATLDLDLDNLTGVCPFCGHKILIDISQLNDLLVEKEKTKQEIAITKRESEKELSRREIEKTMQEKERTIREELASQYDLERLRLEIESKERLERENSKRDHRLKIVKIIATPFIIATGGIVLSIIFYVIFNPK